MESLPTQDQTLTASSKPSKESKSSKIILILMGLVILVLIGEGIYYFKWQRKKRVSEGPPSSTTQVFPTTLTSVPALTNLQIAEKVLSWLETQKNEEGFYNFGVRCELGGVCQKPDHDGRSGFGVLWGYFKHYQKTKNPSDMEKIDYLLTLYSDREKMDIIQNIFWNCKWMYEMRQADFFTDKQKEEIENICRRGNYYPAVTEEVESKIEESGLRAADFEEAIREKQSLSQVANKKLSDEQEKYLLRFAVYASDFVAKYLWHSNEQDLKEAKGYFFEAVGLWKQAPINKYLDGQCLLGIAAVDLYRGTQEQKYLDFAQNLAVEGNTPYFLLEKAGCALLAKDLSVLIQGEKYKKLAADLVKNLINNNFDFTGYSGYANNFGAFYSRENWADKQNLYYFVRENGLIVGILSE